MHCKQCLWHFGVYEAVLARAMFDASLVHSKLLCTQLQAMGTHVTDVMQGWSTLRQGQRGVRGMNTRSFVEMSWFVPDIIPRVHVEMDVIVASSSKRVDTAYSLVKVYV